MVGPSYTLIWVEPVDILFWLPTNGSKFQSKFCYLQAAIGILTYSQENLDVQLKESWYVYLYSLFYSFAITTMVLCMH